MQTENLKFCGIASCDVNNPFFNVCPVGFAFLMEIFFSNKSEGEYSLTDKLLQPKDIFERRFMWEERVG